MRYAALAAAMIGAVVAMPAAPASYGEAPASYGQSPDSYGQAPDSYGSENVYGTVVSHKPATTAAAIASSTCTDEAENVVPFTSSPAVPQSQVVESSVPSVSSVSSVPAKQTSATSSEASPAETPLGYASQSVASSSPVKPAETQPAAYTSAPAVKPTSTEVSPVQSTAPAVNSQKSTVTEHRTETAFGSVIVPGASSATPYPVSGSTPAGYGAASGTAGVAKPSGTGSVNGGYQSFEGAASSLSVAGIFVSFGAIAALFM